MRKTSQLTPLEFFDNLEEQFRERYEKVKKENDMVFFEAVPEKPEDLPEPKCNIEPADFEFPATDKSKWTDTIYLSISAKRDAVEEAKAKAKASGGCCVIS